MVRTHRAELRKVRVETASLRDEHKQLLAEAKRIAREDLEAHKRALAANPWLMLLVKMYERTR
jgi:hypothetical protein